MGEFELVSPIKTALFLQARIGSERLPAKVLKILGGQTVIEHAMDSLRLVNCDANYILTDKSSYSHLLPYAQKKGFKLFVGSENDVLSRFCDAIREVKPTYIIRATADNPAVSYEVAKQSLSLLIKENCDYAGITGIPYGSGVEAVKATALLKCEQETQSRYDREHVTPYIYNNRDKFIVKYKEASTSLNFPLISVTIDTPSDFSNMSDLYNNYYQNRPFSIKELSQHLPNSIENVIIASVKKGNGIGHIVRSLKLASSLGKSGFYTSNPEKITQIAKSLKLARPWFANDFQLNKAKRVLIDNRVTSLNMLPSFSKDSLLFAIDEGGALRSYADYCVDLLPNLLTEKPNIAISPLKKINVVDKTRKYDILIAFGGEDREDLTTKVLNFLLSKFDKYSIAVVRGPNFIKSDFKRGEYAVFDSPDSLEPLFKSSKRIITTFGLTAFEALSYKIPVYMVHPSKYHYKLAKESGFKSFGIKCVDKRKLFNCLKLDLPTSEIGALKYQTKSYAQIIKELPISKILYCPVCGSKKRVSIFRDNESTFFRCKSCKNSYLEGFYNQNVRYSEEYFFDEYKQQYGQSYLEDFENIYQLGIRRIDEFQSRIVSNKKPLLLDIGAAYGPFVKASYDNGYDVYALDISTSAVAYLNKQSWGKAKELDFQEFSNTYSCNELWSNFLKKTKFDSGFGLNRKFDVVTMWFVIEHFTDLVPVLDSVQSLLSNRGMFAFSTPNASGISSRKSLSNFLKNSPRDHHTVLTPYAMKRLLKNRGYKKVKIVITGHHPERFFSKEVSKFRLKIASFISHIFGLGDTFECYAYRLDKE